MNAPKIHVHINLAGCLGATECRIGEVIRNVTLSVGSVELSTEENNWLPNAFLIYQIENAAQPPTETKRLCSRWLIGIGLRDAIEAATLLCEELWKALTLADMRSSSQIAVPSAFANRAELRSAVEKWLQPKVRKFDSAGLKGKLDMLEARLGSKPEWTNEVLSINRARTCLTHRGGRVGDKDCNCATPNSLRVDYRIMELGVRYDDGSEHPVLPGVPLEQAGEVFVQVGINRFKSFEIGSQIEFTSSEFVGMVYTIHMFCRQLTQRVEDAFKDMGMLSEARPAESRDS